MSFDDENGQLVIVRTVGTGELSQVVFLNVDLTPPITDNSITFKNMAPLPGQPVKSFVNGGTLYWIEMSGNPAVATLSGLDLSTLQITTGSTTVPTPDVSTLIVLDTVSEFECRCSGERLGLALPMVLTVQLP